jgi:hypothetical protein
MRVLAETSDARPAHDDGWRSPGKGGFEPSRGRDRASKVLLGMEYVIFARGTGSQAS